MKDYILISVVVIAIVAIFYALIDFLGGYGALIAACIIAGLANETHERTTRTNV